MLLVLAYAGFGKLLLVLIAHVLAEHGCLWGFHSSTFLVCMHMPVALIEGYQCMRLLAHACTHPLHLFQY